MNKLYVLLDYIKDWMNHWCLR